MGFSDPFKKCLNKLKINKKIEYSMYIICAIVIGVFFFIVADDSRLQAMGVGVLFLLVPMIVAFGVLLFVTLDYDKKIKDLYKFYGQEIAVPVASEIPDTSLDFSTNELDRSKINSRIGGGSSVYHRFFFNTSYKKLEIHGTSKREGYSGRNVFGKTRYRVIFDGIITNISGVKDSPSAIEIHPRKTEQRLYKPEMFFEFKTSNPTFHEKYVAYAKVPVLGEKYLTKELADAILSIDKALGSVKLEIDRDNMVITVFKPYFGDEINIKKTLDYDVELAKARVIRDELVSFLDAFCSETDN